MVSMSVRITLSICKSGELELEPVGFLMVFVATVVVVVLATVDLISPESGVLILIMLLGSVDELDNDEDKAERDSSSIF